MSLSTLFNDMSILGVLLLGGFILRQLVKPFKKYYIPSAVIAGIAGLITGPQVLGIMEIPDSFKGMPGILIGMIMTAIVFGTKIDKSRVKGYLDYTVVVAVIYGVQLVLGVVLGILFRGIWAGLPAGWGVMGVFSFWGGHGTAGAAGTVFRELGSEDHLGMGMILSTVGLISAIVIGMTMVNWGLRKRYGNYYRSDGSAGSLKDGLIPEGKGSPIGRERVGSGDINSLALQISFLMVCMVAGTSIVGKAAEFLPFAGKIPKLVHGMFGAAIIWPLMLKFKVEGYVDKKTIGTISGFLLEVVIVTAISTLNLKLMTSFFIPILLYSGIIITVSLILAVFLSKRFCKDDWFEKACMAFGMSSGAVPTGLALVRCVDPDMESSAPDAQGVAATLFTPVFAVMPAVAPIMALQSQGMLIVTGLLIIIIPLVAGLLLRGKKVPVLSRN